MGVGTQGGLINLSAADYRSRPDSISGTPTKSGAYGGSIPYGNISEKTMEVANCIARVYFGELAEWPKALVC